MDGSWFSHLATDIWNFYEFTNFTHYQIHVEAKNLSRPAPQNRADYLIQRETSYSIHIHAFHKHRSVVDTFRMDRNNQTYDQNFTNLKLCTCSRQRIDYWTWNNRVYEPMVQNARLYVTKTSKRQRNDFQWISIGWCSIGAFWGEALEIYVMSVHIVFE